MTNISFTEEKDSILETAISRQQTADFDIKMTCKPLCRACLGKSFLQEIVIGQQSA